MRRVAFEVYLEVEVPDDAPDPHLDLVVEEDGSLRVAVGELEPEHPVLLADGGPTPTRAERDAAAEAAAVLLTADSSELAAVERELALMPVSRKGVKVRGSWVERVPSFGPGEDSFAVFDGGLPGPALPRAEAALVVLQREQRRRMAGN